MINKANIHQGKILIVDDQKPNILLLERSLRGAGFESIASTLNPSEVCELHLLNRYDLILLDLEMPGMDGFQVMENLKEIETDSYLPVLVITAQKEHKVRALKAGAKDFISKPLDLAEVLVRVYNMLEVRLLHLESRKLYARLLAEQKVSERLLLKVLPYSLAEKLTTRPVPVAPDATGLITESFAEVAVLFADIVEFTKFSESANGEILAGVLTDLSTRFYKMEGTSGFNRVKTIDDAYLASVGLSDAVAIHTIRAAQMAFDLIEAIDRFNDHTRFKLKLRIGLEAGAAAFESTGEGTPTFDL